MNFQETSASTSAHTSAPVVEFTTTSGLTIVRLKRKRNEEPLDALGMK